MGGGPPPPAELLFDEGDDLVVVVPVRPPFFAEGFCWLLLEREAVDVDEVVLAGFFRSGWDVCNSLAQEDDVDDAHTIAAVWLTTTRRISTKI